MEEKEVDETDNTHLALALIKIRKGIGIKHKYCFGCKQLTSVYHKHFTTKMLKIQQETQERGRKGKLRPKTHNWTRILGLKLRIFYLNIQNYVFPPKFSKICIST